MGSDRPASKPQSRFFPAMKSPMLPKGTFNGRTALITGGGTGILYYVANVFCLPAHKAL
jgi:hypothetical protein